MRTVIAGHSVTIGDGAVWLAIKRNEAAAKAAAAGGAAAHVHVKRWFKYMDGLPACVQIAQDFLGVSKVRPARPSWEQTPPRPAL